MSVYYDAALAFRNWTLYDMDGSDPWDQAAHQLPVTWDNFGQWGNFGDILAWSILDFLVSVWLVVVLLLLYYCQYFFLLTRNTNLNSVRSYLTCPKLPQLIS